MALLTAGYWPTTYWPSRYWDPNYWPHYGVAAPPVVPEAIVYEYPLPIRTQFFVDIPVELLIRSPFQTGFNAQVLVRKLHRQEVIMESTIRKMFNEVFEAKTFILNKKTKKLLRVLKEYLVLEEAA